MIKKRSYKIPLYHRRLYVLFIEEMESLEKEMNFLFDVQGGDVKEASGGYFELDGHHYVVFEINKMTPGIIAHECKHFVNGVFRNTQIGLDLWNDEPECYLLGWAVDRVHEAKEKLLVVV